MTQFAVVLAAFGVVSALVTKSTDFVRNAFDANDTWPKWTWNVVPIVIGLIYCLGWQVDLSASVVSLVPALASHASRLTGVAGQAFTGVLAGGFAGFLHEVFDSLSGIAKATKRAGSS